DATPGLSAAMRIATRQFTNSPIHSFTNYWSLLRQRIRPQLEVHHLAGRSLPRFHVERRASADRRVHSSALPPCLRIVDPAVHPLGIETRRIRHAQHDPLTV